MLLLMHGIAHSLCVNTIREPALKELIGEKFHAALGGQTHVSRVLDLMPN